MAVSWSKCAIPPECQPWQPPCAMRPTAAIIAADGGSTRSPHSCTSIEVACSENRACAIGPRSSSGRLQVPQHETLTFDFCLSTSTRFDNKHIRSCLASRRSVSRRGPMAQGDSPHNPMAFSSVLYPGRCLASQPIHLGSEVGVGPKCKRRRPRAPPQVSTPPPLSPTPLLGGVVLFLFLSPVVLL